MGRTGLFPEAGEGIDGDARTTAITGNPQGAIVLCEHGRGNRHRGVHRVRAEFKRLMLIAAISMLMPAFGRMPWPMGTPFPVIPLVTYTLFLTPVVAWDIASRGRIHPATLWGGGALIMSWLFRLAIWHTPVWLAFATWATSFQ